MGNKQLCAYDKFRQRFQQPTYLAEGNFGIVYKVKDTEKNDIKIEKVIKNYLQIQEKTKIISEVDILIKLDHPHIVKAYDYLVEQRLDNMDVTKKRQYLHIIMQYIKGKQLKEYLGKLNKMQVLNIYKQIKSAILYLQGKKIIHRDLSLDNILIDQQFSIKLTDFGIANQLKNKSYYTNDRRFGKMPYLAPEAWHFKITGNSDLWAVGIIVLQLFFGKKITELYNSQRPGDDFQFPKKFFQQYRGKIPQQIKKIVEPLLERDHNKRRFYEFKKQQEQQDKIIVFKNIKTYKKIHKHMTSLQLSSCRINTEGAIEISEQLTRLTKLYLNNNNIGTRGAIQIAMNLKNLTELYLSSNQIGNQGTIQIARNLKNLKHLDLDNNNITNEGVIQISYNLKNLIILWLNDNKIGIQGGMAIAKELKNLTTLSLNNNNIGFEGVFQISKNLKKLATLHLSNNNVKTQGVIEIAKNLRNLSTLSLNNNNIKSECIIEIVKNMRNLNKLSLNKNKIGAEAIIQLIKNLKDLKYLDCRENEIDENGRSLIKQSIINQSFQIKY